MKVMLISLVMMMFCTGCRDKKVQSVDSRESSGIKLGTDVQATANSFSAKLTAGSFEVGVTNAGQAFSSRMLGPEDHNMLVLRREGEIVHDLPMCAMLRRGGRSRQSGSPMTKNGRRLRNKAPRPSKSPATSSLPPTAPRRSQPLSVR